MIGWIVTGVAVVLLVRYALAVIEEAYRHSQAWAPADEPTETTFDNEDETGPQKDDDSQSLIEHSQAAVEYHEVAANQYEQTHRCARRKVRDLETQIQEQKARGRDVTEQEAQLEKARATANGYQMLAEQARLAAPRKRDAINQHSRLLGSCDIKL